MPKSKIVLVKDKKEALLGILSGAGAVYVAELIFFLLYFLVDDIVYRIILNTSDISNVLKYQIRAFLIFDVIFVIGIGYLFSKRIETSKKFKIYFLASFIATFIIELTLKIKNIGFSLSGLF